MCIFRKYATCYMCINVCNLKLTIYAKCARIVMFEGKLPSFFILIGGQHEQIIAFVGYVGC